MALGVFGGEGGGRKKIIISRDQVGAPTTCSIWLPLTTRAGPERNANGAREQTFAPASGHSKGTLEGTCKVGARPNPLLPATVDSDKAPPDLIWPAVFGARRWAQLTGRIPLITSAGGPSPARPGPARIRIRMGLGGGELDGLSNERRLFQIRLDCS